MRGRQSGEMVARWTMFAVGTMVSVTRAAATATATATATTRIGRVQGWFLCERRGYFVYDRLNLFAVVCDFSLGRSRVDGFFRLCEQDSHSTHRQTDRPGSFS